MSGWNRFVIMTVDKCLGNQKKEVLRRVFRPDIHRQKNVMERYHGYRPTTVLEVWISIFTPEIDA
jgi:hypothetical protein